MIQLYALPLSAYCTKVRIVLRIKEIPFEETPPAGDHYSSDAYQAHMPPGTIPAVEDDGFKLFDSEAIVEYLEDVFPNPSMRAADPRIRGRQRAISQFHNTRVEPAVRALFPLVKQPQQAWTERAVREAHAEFQRQLEKLEQVVAPDPFVGGASPCLADCGFPATLRMGQDLFGFLGLRATFGPVVDPWLEALEGHPVIGDEVSKNRQAIAAWLDTFR
jgi:glutathione S-transferase/maleylpyruvate isomerase